MPMSSSYQKMWFKILDLFFCILKSLTIHFESWKELRGAPSSSIPSPSMTGAMCCPDELEQKMLGLPRTLVSVWILSHFILLLTAVCSTDNQRSLSSATSVAQIHSRFGPWRMNAFLTSVKTFEVHYSFHLLKVYHLLILTIYSYIIVIIAWLRNIFFPCLVYFT